MVDLASEHLAPLRTLLILLAIAPPMLLGVLVVLVAIDSWQPARGFAIAVIRG